MSQRIQSWQAHLQRISPYLQQGEGVWWKGEAESYKFFDSDHDCNYRPEGPPLLHFRCATVQGVHTRSGTAWEHIINANVTLPTPYIRLYDSGGRFTGRRNYSSANNQSNPPSNNATQELRSSSGTDFTILVDQPFSHPGSPPSPHPRGLGSTSQGRHPSPQQRDACALHQRSLPSPYTRNVSATYTSLDSSQASDMSATSKEQDNPPPGNSLPFAWLTEMCLASQPKFMPTTSKDLLAGSTPVRILSQTSITSCQDTTAFATQVQTLSQTLDNPMTEDGATSFLQPVELFSVQNENEHISCTETEEDTVSEVTIDNTPDTLCDDISREATSLRTKAAVLIQKVIGTTKALTDFNTMRTELKKKNASKRSWKPTATQKQEYGRVLAVLQTSVLSMEYSLKLHVSIKRTETEYHTHGTFPTRYHHEYALLRKKLDYTKKL